MGYVGLPTALSFAAAGRSVVGIDVSERRLSEIRRKEADLVADDRERLARALPRPDFELTSDTNCLTQADTIVVCVPTPVDEHRSPDLTALAAACRTVVEKAQPGQLVILTSTTYVGTTRELFVGPVSERGFIVGRDIFLAFSPERIDPGNTQFPQDKVPRVVGGVTPECTERARKVLGQIAPVHVVSSPEAAEFTKLYENIFRAVNIALVNEISDVTQALGIDVMEVIEAAATKPYGFMPFYPGPGVGGHCIPCDPHYLLWQLRARRVPAPLIRQAMEDIDLRPGRVVQRATEVLSADAVGLRQARVLIAGVAYKPGVQDVRESPALEIIAGLREKGCEVSFVDAYVDALELPDGERLSSVGQVNPLAYDLAVAVTLHPGSDYSWMSEFRHVLDATYRLGDSPNIVQV
jgi:UDP-N-acetyl-D-glucosamine dehydrogenase